MLKIKLIVILMFACAMTHSQEISNLLGKWAVLDTLPLAVKYKIQLQEFNKARVLEIAKVDKAAIAQELAHPTKLRQSECVATYASNGSERALNLKRTLPQGSKKESEIFYYTDGKKSLYLYKNLKYAVLENFSYALEEPIFTQYLTSVPVFPQLSTWVGFKDLLKNGKLSLTKNGDTINALFKVHTYSSKGKDVFENYNICIKDGKISSLQLNKSLEKDGMVVDTMPVECEIKYLDYAKIGEVEIPRQIEINRYFAYKNPDKASAEYEQIKTSCEKLEVVEYSTDGEAIKKEFAVNIEKGTRISDSIQDKSYIVGDFLDKLEKNVNAKK